MTEISEEIPEVSAETAVPGKCTLQFVLIAALKLKYLSNLTQKDRSTAGTAFLTTGLPERTAIKCYPCN
jgi:hypothetical protein